jgi:Cft2 family RNA processing exonuclease/dsRNA-specific ribonuclease
MSATTELKLTFLGGAGSIGASCALLEAAGTSLLIDCGVRFRADKPLPDLDLLTGKKIDAIIVTHAHSDHTGGLPVAHEAFPSAPILMTPPTLDLVGVLQRDALKIMGMAEREGDMPLYAERQVEGMLQQIRPVHHHHAVQVGEILVTFLPASHILGASMVHFATPAGAALFTGDYSVGAQKTVPALERPALPVDLVVSESTYGNRLHADRGLSEDRLVRAIGETLERGGRVLVPAFAIGRAQEVLLVVKDAMRARRLPEVPVFVDGMVRAVCGVYAQHERYVTPQLARQMRTGHPFFTGTIRPVRRPDERKEVLDAGPCVIVSSSGMLQGGPSAYYAAELAPGERDAILITGYQDEESPGASLLRLAAERGPRRLRLGGKEVDVRCRFETYGLSAHADRMQMMGLVEALSPTTVVLVHGDREAKESLCRSLGERDVALADDGAQIARSFRKASPTRRGRGPLSAAAARRLVGPDMGEPLRASALALAWLGKAPDGAALERFVGELVAAGAARRDDRDRGLLWSLVPAAITPRGGGGRADRADEPALVEQLKAENPKGKLLERCAREGLEPPSFVELPAAPDPDQHVVQATLPAAPQTGGKRLDSGPQRAFSQKVAEQLAARALLAQLSGGDPGAGSTRSALSGGEGGDGGSGDDAPPARVDEAREAELRRHNPKGRLAELCAKQRLDPASLQATPVAGGFLGRGSLLLPDGTTLATGRYLARQAKLAEQAAAAELLDALLGAAKAAQGAPSPPPVGKPTREARSVLNEMRQLGLIADYGFEELERRGPAHQPVFVVRGWTEGDGGRSFTASFEARSRKDAEAAAAPALLALAIKGSDA